MYKMFTPKTSAIYGKYFIRQKGFAAFGWSFFEREYALNFSVIVRFGIENGKKPRLPSGIMCTFVVGKTGL